MVEEYNESLSSFAGDERSVKKLKEVKPYVERLKRHKDAILSLWSVGG
jgi:WD40 repeat protein